MRLISDSCLTKLHVIHCSGSVTEMLGPTCICNENVYGAKALFSTGNARAYRVFNRNVALHNM